MFSSKRIFGNRGESIAARTLASKGYVILDRNYLKKWGEIDIVARGTDKIIHFVEVKTVSRETYSKSISRDTFMPEENVTREKIMKIERVVQSWMEEHSYEGEWQIDVIAVEIDPTTGREVVRHIECVY